SEPPSLARLDWRATVAERGGGHPFGEPERAHIIPLRGSDAPRIHDAVPARSTRCGPACWRELYPAHYGATVEPPRQAKVHSRSSSSSLAAAERRERPA